MNFSNIAEYAIVGAGPAALCAISNLLKIGVTRQEIIWIDPEFRVGNFGSIFCMGSSVPGNTRVKNYQKVHNEIYKIIPDCAPNKDQSFQIDHMDPSKTCSLKVAAEPLQHITNKLRNIVNSLEGKVLNISTFLEGFQLEIKLTDNESQLMTAKRIILATGGQPRRITLPSACNAIKMINPHTAFIQSEVTEYINKNPGITTVAVIGSSHSAALASMHLLQAGLTVKQLMNKEYKFAQPAITPDGIQYTLHNNTGLKGEVAEFTRQLLTKKIYKNNWFCHIAENKKQMDALLETHLMDCSHMVAAIGYEPASTLHINNLTLSHYQYNNQTTEFENLPGIFGIGIAFPRKVTSPAGEIEFGVGVDKFWETTSNPDILNIWGKCPVFPC